MKRLFGSAFLVVLILVLWAFFAPMQLGGKTVYLILQGNSMSPLFQYWDLVLTKPSDNYRRGDVVAYFNPDLDHYVLHRIAKFEDQHYHLKGDSNDWIDNFRPTASEIAGKIWFRIPKLGRLVYLSRSPAIFTGIFGVTLIVFTFLFLSGKGNQMKKNTSGILDKGEWLSVANSVLIFASLFSFIFACVSFSNPLNKTVLQALPLVHHGGFSYSGNAPEGIYNGPAVTDGQPIFPEHTCLISLSFWYQLDGVDLRSISGVVAVNATIEDPGSGWSKKLYLSEDRAFDGNQFTTVEEINFCDVTDSVSQLEEITGIYAPRYRLKITPEIIVQGVTVNTKFVESFSPSLPFTFDHLSFSLSSGADDESVLYSLKESEIPSSFTVKNAINFLGLNLNILGLRIASSMIFVVSTILLSALLIYYQKLKRSDPLKTALLKNEQRVISIETNSSHIPQKMITIRSFSELSDLAKVYDEQIFHFQADKRDVYFFEHGSTRYQYQKN